MSYTLPNNTKKHKNHNIIIIALFYNITTIKFQYYPKNTTNTLKTIKKLVKQHIKPIY